MYIGYFGAAGGVVLLAILSMMFTDSLIRINALKNVISGAANAVAATAFALFAPVDWAVVPLLAVGFLVGGMTGPRLARRLPVQALRALVALAWLSLLVKLASARTAEHTNYPPSQITPRDGKISLNGRRIGTQSPTDGFPLGRSRPFCRSGGDGVRHHSHSSRGGARLLPVAAGSSDDPVQAVRQRQSPLRPPVLRLPGACLPAAAAPGGRSGSASASSSSATLCCGPGHVIS